MDKISIANNFTQNFTDISSTEESYAIATPIQINHQAVEYIRPETLPLDNFWNALLKRGFDIIVSIILIVCILSWLIPLLAIIIKLNSRGPVFFLQKRNKNGGLLFTCIKFRSMFVNNEADTLVASENDARITSVGKFIRKYHIDELPQLINVLIGDMSLIGPRPHMVSENIKYENLLHEYDCRHAIKPGITGLAQSLGNFGSSNLEQVKERVRLDIEYINKWSLILDIKILCRTSLSMLGFMKLNK